MKVPPNASGARPDDENDRWRRVEALYHEIRVRPARERAAALLAACPNDPAMAAEVQALLDQPESATGFLATPPAEVAAGLVSKAGPSLIGQRIGAFEVQSLLGLGGMGEVYRARDTRLGRDVAIKVLPEAFARDAPSLARFDREARALASLNHPNILGVYDVGTHEGTAFVVTELLEGRTLRDVLAPGALPLRKTVDYATQIANGLAAAHEKGIVHRDLKPANIWVTNDGRVKILDFGLARIVTASSVDVPSGSTMTGAGTVLGTAGYMAPEQVRGEPADHRADIFSFGVVLYEMLTGRRAFVRDSTPGTLAAILDADPPSWPGDGSAASLRLLRLAHRCLEKQPQARLQSARDLTLFLSDEGSEASSMPGHIHQFIHPFCIKN